MRIALVLVFSIGAIAQASSSLTSPGSSPPAQTDLKEQKSEPPASAQEQPAGQARKRAHVPPNEHNNQPSAAPPPGTPVDSEATGKSSTFGFITKQATERWLQIYVALTGVLALVALGALVVMRRQLKEMRVARRQTDILLKHAMEHSSALQDTSDQTRSLLEQAIEQTNHAAEQAKAANMAACAAKTSSESFAQVANASVESIHVAQQAMHLEQRAWVFVTETRASELQIGHPLSITIGFKNTGRTPARNVQVAACLEPLPKGQAPDPNLDKTQSRGVIPPNGTISVTISTGRGHAEGVTEQGLKAIASGELVIWIYGTITYDDIFSTRQATMFCYMLHPDGKTFIAAEVYNDAT